MFFLQLPLIGQEVKDATDILIVEYKFYRKLTDRSLPKNEIHSLKNYNSKLSFYEIEKSSAFLNKREIEGSEISANIDPDGSESLITFKDFSKDTLMAVYPVIRRYKKVGERIPHISWKLEESTKEILGYKCKKATATFRGRNYIAYYTPEISVFDGPFKFSGLPGLILSVVEDNKKISFEAVYLERKKVIAVPANPIEKENLLSWSEYKQEYKKAFDRFGKFVNSKIAENSNSKTNVQINRNGIYPPSIEVLNFNE